MLRRQLFGLMAGAAALAGISSPALATDPVRIGYTIARTGLFAAAAPSQEQAYTLWAEQVNAAGGLDVAGEMRPIEFVSYDDESDPAKAAQLYERLITSDNVDLLLAPWGTPHHLNVAGVVERYGFPMVGNTAASVMIREVQPGNIWFPTSAIPDQIGPALAQMLHEAGIQSVAILANVLPYSQENLQFLTPALQAQGIEILMSENYPPDISDMTPLLTQVRAAEPDAVLALTYPADAFLYTGQARELGIAPHLQFLLIGPTIDAFGKAFGPAADGIVTLAHWSPEQEAWPRARPFFDAYVARFDQEPDYLDSALAYMSVEILQQAVAQAGLDHDALRAAIANGTFDTINGEVRFDGVQNAITPTAFVQRQDGRMQLVWPPEIATAPLVTR
ncbi:MAG: amino acid ABC transporter substrate-binding protein [Rhodobacter sp.]|nr:amino acid ABC transporter substrate-binding protein [Paracoccaceae bacterium]MCC0076253.1 amino acid ABC transporter substrate-binding protein [Rhodobacter sp.]